MSTVVQILATAGLALAGAGLVALIVALISGAADKRKEDEEYRCG